MFLGPSEVVHYWTHLERKAVGIGPLSHCLPWLSTVGHNVIERQSTWPLSSSLPSDVVHWWTHIDGKVDVLGPSLLSPGGVQTLMERQMA